MRGYDLLLFAAIIATFFLTIGGLAIQKYWRIFEVLMGKKHGLLVYACLVAFGWLEVLIVSFFDYRSAWQFRPLWILGLPLVAAAVWLFVKSLAESGKGVLVSAHLFGRKAPKSGPIHKKYKYPLYLSIVIFYIGLCLTTGKIGYGVAALLLAVCFSLKAFVERPTKVAKR